MEKKKMKVSLKLAIVLIVTLIGILICTCIFTYYFINKDIVISRIIDIDINEYKNFKNNFIGANIIIDDDDNTDELICNSKKIEFKNQAKENFKTLENYVLNSDKNIAQKLLNDLETQDLHTISENSEISLEMLNKFYSYVFSGLLKNSFNTNKFNMNIEKIRQYVDSIEIYITINNYYAIFNYGESACGLYFYEDIQYNKIKKDLSSKKIQGYDDLEYWYSFDTLSDYKPIIYLYPTENTEISVKLLKDYNITCSYPKYQDEWNVLAKPNGDLEDLTTNRKLYSLYYENKNSIDFKVENDGFIVEGKDSAKFLEEKLAILGLTEREAEEFIIYWLPKLEANNYNYIRFVAQDEINENMPIEINPNPDTIIRILMIFKGLDSPIHVEEQELTAPERTGFVAVEWGGTELK